MEKPFQKDIDFLKEELVHHEYIAGKYEQECNKIREQEFKQQCLQILAAIKTMEDKQATAIAEWSALSPPKRHTILLPLFETLEKTVDIAKENDCQEFAAYLDAYLSGFLIDLQNFTG